MWCGRRPAASRARPRKAGEGRQHGNHERLHQAMGAAGSGGALSLLPCRWLSFAQLPRAARMALTQSAATRQLPSCCGIHDTSQQCMPEVGLLQCDSPSTMPVRRTARCRRGSRLTTPGSQPPYSRSPDLPIQAAIASPHLIDPDPSPLDRSPLLGASTASLIPDTQQKTCRLLGASRSLPTHRARPQRTKKRSQAIYAWTFGAWGT
jgi:hypothetical protein